MRQTDRPTIRLGRVDAEVTVSRPVDVWRSWAAQNSPWWVQNIPKRGLESISCQKNTRSPGAVYPQPSSCFSEAAAAIRGGFLAHTGPGTLWWMSCFRMSYIKLAGKAGDR